MFNRQHRGSSHPGKHAGIETEESGLGRGFLSGLTWGSILSVMLVWVASQMGGMIEVLKAPVDVATVAPESSVVVLPESSAVTPPAAEQVTARPEDSQLSVVPPESAEPEVSAADAPPIAQGESVAAPEMAEVDLAPDAPSAGWVPSIAAEGDAPARSPDATPPSQITADRAPRKGETAPIPEFTQPVVVEPAAPAQPETPADIAPEAVTAPGDEAAPAAPDTGTPPEVVGVPDAPPVEAEPAPVPEPAPEPESDPVPDTSPDTAPETPPETPTETPSETAEAVPTGVLEPSGELADLAPEVRVNRLPTIGGDSQEIAPEPETDEAAPSGGPAIARFAAPFSNPGDKPIMAILLIDDGGPRPSVEEMAALPFPVSYVVDAARPDAAAAMDDYRRAGHEVVAMTPLPDGADPSDVEVSFETYLDRVPEAVAVIDTQAAAFQSGRQVARQIAQILAAEGLGMITYSKGLNAATQVAGREGVPAKVVFREIDSDGRDSAAIQRFLDQAAFRAGQQSGVILIGHNRPETVAALLDWGLGNRAATIALAPISVALLTE